MYIMLIVYINVFKYTIYDLFICYLFANNHIYGCFNL